MFAPNKYSFISLHNYHSAFQKRKIRYECRRFNLLYLFRFCSQNLLPKIQHISALCLLRYKINIRDQKEIFKPPIRMTEECGHNFCQDCLSSLDNDQNEWLCPECRSVQSRQPDKLMRNRLVEKAVESFNVALTQIQVTNLCSHHNLELSLCKFCKFILRVKNFLSTMSYIVFGVS